MAGYAGFTMSNNAIGAYFDGSKPISKWQKKDFMDGIGDITHEFSDILFSKLKKDTLKSLFLVEDGWHHTSKMYNKTKFFVLDAQKIGELTDADLLKILEVDVVPAEKSAPIYHKVEFLTWCGSRNYRKSTKHIETVEIKGQWAFTSFGKKSITGTGFRFLEEVK